MKKIKLVKIIVGCFLILSIFNLAWMYELKEITMINNYETLRGYCSSQIGGLDYYDKFMYVSYRFTNGFGHFNMQKTYHILLYFQIAIGFLSAVLLIYDKK